MKYSKLRLENDIPISHMMADNNDNLWLKTEPSSSSEPGDLFYYNVQSQVLIKNDKWKNNANLIRFKQLNFTRR